MITKIACLIPAHNEEKNISNTINSLLRQIVDENVKIDIFIICDNCTDCTEEKVKYFSSIFSTIHLIKTSKNIYKKSGALNCGYEYTGLLNYDYFLCMDADTIIDYNLISEALKEFKNDSKLGAVCSKAGLLNQNGKNILNKFLYHIQKIEYGEFDASRIERYGFIKVIHGMCAIYKKEAIDSIRKLRQFNGMAGQIYDINNITEDYDLTLSLRKCGYNVNIGLNMNAWTEVPLTLKELWNQRIRWLSGGLYTLKTHKLNKITYRDIFNTGFFWIIIPLQTYLLLSTIINIYNFNINTQALFVLGLMYIDSLYRLKYVQNIDKWDYLLRLSFIPQIIYAWFNILQQIWAYKIVLTNSKKEW